MSKLLLYNYETEIPVSNVSVCSIVYSLWRTQCSLVAVITQKYMDLNVDSYSCIFQLSQSRNSEIQAGLHFYRTLFWLQKTNTSSA